MKKTLTLLLSVFTLLAYGQLPQTQKVDVNWGEAFKSKKTIYSKVLKTEGDLIYVLKFVKGETIIEVIDKNLNSKKEIPVSEEMDGDDLTYEGLVSFQDNFVIMCSMINKKEKTNSLYYSTISESGSQSKWTKLVSMDYLKKRKSGDFSYDISQDSSKFMLYYNVPFEGKDAPEKFGFLVLDEKLDQIWQKEIELSYNESLFYVTNFEVDDIGNAYILGREYAAKEDRIKGMANYKYHILSYKNEGLDYKDFEIALDDKFITDITFGFSNENITCAGFYSENGQRSIKGSFYVLIDGETQKPIKSTFKPFDEDFITQDWTEKQINKAKKKEKKKNKAIEAYEYDLRDFIVHSDGGVTMLAEQYYVHVVTTTTTDANGNTTTKTTYHYYYNDIIIVDISNEGTINWTSKIDKYQHSIDDGGYMSSYALMVTDDKLHMIYNMRARNVYEKDERKELTKEEKKAYLTLFVTVDNKGEVEEEILIDNRQEETFIVPKLCEEFGDNQMFLFTQRGGKTKKLGTITLK
jgi:hypothetical protein